MQGPFRGKHSVKSGIISSVKNRDPILFAAVVDTLRFSRGMNYKQAYQRFYYYTGIGEAAFDALASEADEVSGMGDR